MTAQGGLGRLRDGVILAGGGVRALLALGAGAVTALGLPPLGLLPAPVLGFGVLVLLLDGASGGRGALAAARAGFGIGALFGFGYFLASLWWIGLAATHDGGRFAWALPLAMAGLPALLALFVGAGTAFARLLWSDGAMRILALAAGLGLADYARGLVATGFPWNSFGLLLTAQDIPLQAAVLGIEALNGLAPLVFAAPVLLLDPARPRSARPLMLTLALALVLGQWGYGLWRLQRPAPAAPEPEVRVRVVQPLFTQAERRQPDSLEEVLSRYIALTQAADPGGADAPTHVIWPEAALPFTIERAEALLPHITRMLRPGAVLIAGLLRGDDTGSGGVFNALYVFADDGRVLQRYDKTHLVPFGEYVPFPALATRIGLEPLTRVLAFVPGSRRTALATPGAPPFRPLICYEVIFPRAASAADTGAGWIVTISDDSWFGYTWGPHQHLHHARLRAVEEGLPLARSTTTGVSALIDGAGRVMGQVPLGQSGFVQAALPGARSDVLDTDSRWLLFVLQTITLTILAFFARIGLGRR